MRVVKRAILVLAVVAAVAGLPSAARASSDPGKLCARITAGTEQPTICVPLY